MPPPVLGAASYRSAPAIQRKATCDETVTPCHPGGCAVGRPGDCSRRVLRRRGAHAHAHARPPAVATAAVATTVKLHRPVVRVAIHDFKFQPAHLVVSRGTRVIWTNKDSDPHTISSKPAHWSSQALDTGKSFATVTRKAGTFAYICTIHPFMHGTVVVR
jgi:plastocyanin